MEIERAMTAESSDRRLQTKYRRAVYVIQRALALYPFHQVAFSFNGGKDSTVLLHLLRAAYYLLHPDGNPNCPIRTIYFESPSAFPEINSFTFQTASSYGLLLETIHSDFKSGLEQLLAQKPTQAIFLGTRIGDPNALGQDQFSPSSPGWPPFMRVNPILDWSYRDVWSFLLTCKLDYCTLYDQGYTSIGSIYDTVPNALLAVSHASAPNLTFKPAYMLLDGRLERAGRAKKSAPKPHALPTIDNGANNVDATTSTASIIVIGDQILFGAVEENLGSALCKKLRGIGWQVSHISVVPNEIDAVAEEVELRKSTADMVFIFGALGPLHSDVSLAGVAKAFGVRLAPDEEFEEYLRQLIGSDYTGDRNEMALLPEGITELLHHRTLPVPLIKCKNVIVMAATNGDELETQWSCLLELPETPLSVKAPFLSLFVSTMLSDVEIAKVVSELSIEFPDIHIVCHRTSRNGPVMISFIAKDKSRLDAAIESLFSSLPEGAVCKVDSD
ncbi:phosphoadenosine phosphosulfate (PAPS) reductase family protein [Rhynchospora pubera]|uniref:FAD synthase n=1 Tax=Rhynchospora pubera TaxID=906938 RepID=A0AAV8GYU7_9POAL|nr:phosphoadenosine phosphosulfate (PAPS) reductase family protein [Rhynchospora pubera]